jgi:hypothetical protein
VGDDVNLLAVPYGPAKSRIVTGVTFRDLDRLSPTLADRCPA